MVYEVEQIKINTWASYVYNIPTCSSLEVSKFPLSLLLCTLPSPVGDDLCCMCIGSFIIANCIAKWLVNGTFNCFTT